MSTAAQKAAPQTALGDAPEWQWGWSACKVSVKGEFNSMKHSFYKRFFFFFASHVDLMSPWRDFPGGSDGKASACNVGDPGSIPAPGRSPGEGNGNPLQYSCLENHMDRGARWATVHGVAKSQTRLSDFTSLLDMTRCKDWDNKICS